jgi:hypothetical protein
MEILKEEGQVFPQFSIDVVACLGKIIVSSVVKCSTKGKADIVKDEDM